jgi:subtilisin family serine protease
MPLYYARFIGTNEKDIDELAARLQKRPRYSRAGFSVCGLAEKNELAEFEGRGLIVELFPDDASISWLEPKALPAMPFSADGPLPPAYENLATQADERYIVQFDGPLDDAARAEVRKLNVKLGAYVPDFAYKAALTAIQVNELQNRGFVRRVVPFDTTMTLRRSKLGAAPPDAARSFQPVSGDAVSKPVMYHIRCHSPADLPAVEQVVRGDNRVLKVERGRNRLRISIYPEYRTKVCSAIAELPQVSVVEPFEFPAPLCSFVREVVGIDVPGQAALPWTGKGQVVGVADSGVDTQHPDLRQRLAHVFERVPPAAPDDPFGHGTHVCSLVAGDGTASGGRLRGTAPDCKLVVQALRDANGKYSGLPVNLADLFQQAYDAGARIYNASWGIRGESLYTTDALELDQFVHEHPDFVIVVAAGNDGQQSDPLEPFNPEGRIAYNSIASPATSKNSITVGACCSTRSDGPYEGEPWRRYMGRLPSPRHPLVADEPICGDPDILAAFSSRGPTDDSRIKPDLVVPGTVVLAARSAPSDPSPLDAGHLTAALGQHYTFQNGTSMAAPALAGVAAIVRQYFIEARHWSAPSAALIKATLINGCVWLRGRTVEDPHVGRPNVHQGFGRVDLRKTLPIPGDPSGFTLQFVDVNRGDPKALNAEVSSETAWRKRVRVDGGRPLRVTLCWTDHPAHGLQNHLDLVVTPPDGGSISGNNGLNRGPWAKRDRFNNVERIEVESPTPGEWTVLVNATATPFPTQGFSVVATGSNLSEFF